MANPSSQRIHCNLIVKLQCDLHRTNHYNVSEEIKSNSVASYDQIAHKFVGHCDFPHNPSINCNLHKLLFALCTIRLVNKM